MVVYLHTSHTNDIIYIIMISTYESYTLSKFLIRFSTEFHYSVDLDVQRSKIKHMILQLSDHSKTLSTLLLPCTFAVVAVVAILLLLYGYRNGDSLGNECDFQNLEFSFLSHQFNGLFLFS
jgi:hypothetical protein